MIYAPILIPTLCRYEHFIRLIESLKKNSWAEHTDLIIAIDYSPSPKYDYGRDKICSYLETGNFNDFKSLKIIKRTKNYGAINNGDSLVQEVFEMYDRLVLLPDDIDVAPNFIEYMDKCLEYYESKEEIIAVCGYTYPVKWKVSEGASVLKIQTNCAVWGIGYWKNKYNSTLQDLSNGKVLKQYPYFLKHRLYNKMIDACFREYVEAACYRWCYGHQWLLNMSDIGLRAYLSVMDKYAICPVISKVRNYGFDGSGEYCQKLDNGNVNTFDFTIQSLDADLHFELREDALNLQDENRNLLNAFDKRNKKQMQKSRKLLWLSENIGIWSAKLYCLFGLPVDFIVRAYNKYIR